MDELEARVREQLGFAGELVVLRRAEGVVWRAAGLGIIRVGPRGRSVEIGRALAAAGAPIAPPLAGPFVVAGREIAVWTDAPDGDRRDVAAFEAMGRSLHEFHLARVAVSVTPWDPVAWADARLTAAPDGASDLVRRLRARIAAAARESAGDVALLHTDAHAGNFCVDAGRAVLIDLAGVARGPRLYDLAAMVVTERRFDRPPEHLAAYLAGYGSDEAVLGSHVRLRELLSIAFVVGLGHVEVAAARLEDLAQGRADAVWTPF